MRHWETVYQTRVRGSDIDCLGRCAVNILPTNERGVWKSLSGYRLRKFPHGRIIRAQGAEQARNAGTREGSEVMTFFKRLFGRKEATPVAEAPMAAPECPHVALVPFWDSADDMGKTDKISRYECESCKLAFTREEGERMRTEGAERLRISEEARDERLSE